MSWGVGRRYSLDLELLWLWHRPAATALTRPLAWEPPYAAGAALKRPKKKKKAVQGPFALYGSPRLVDQAFCQPFTVIIPDALLGAIIKAIRHGK